MSIESTSFNSFSSFSNNLAPLLPEELFDALYQRDSDSKDSYKLSVLLLGAETPEAYQDLLEKIFHSLGISPDDSAEQIAQTFQGDTGFTSWILGRILVSSLDHADVRTASKIAEAMDLLLKEAPCTEFSTWAMGYLTIYHAQHPAEYAEMKERLNAFTEQLKKQKGETEKDNVIWALVMNLQSASLAHDAVEYHRLLEEITSYYQTHSVTQALSEKIPQSDFPAWAMALTYLAACRMKDESLCKDLRSVLNEQILASPSQGDQLLALLNLQKAIHSV